MLINNLLKKLYVAFTLIMKISSKIQLINIFIFIFLLSFSKQIVNNNFDKPISNNLHYNFNNYLQEVRSSFEKSTQIRKTSISLCKEVLSGNINRHSLRWVFEKLRIFTFDLNYKIFKKNYLNTYLFAFIISIILFISFNLITMILSQTYKIKNIKFIILNFLFFIFFINLFLNRPVGEMRFSIFELLFVTTSFYFAYKKQFLPYLLSVLLCILNRESGLICSMFWPILNNFNFEKNKISIKFLIDNQNYKTYLPFILSIITIFSLNLDLMKCFSNSNFFIPRDISQSTVINYGFSLLTISNLNGIFVNYFIVLAIILFFYNKSIIQKKIIILISIYLIVFLIFTPIIQFEIRILLVPFIIIYIFDFILNRKSTKYSF